MITDELLERSGINAKRSSIDVPSFRAGALLSTRAERFRSLQQEVVGRSWDYRIAFAMHLIAFDVFNPADIDLLSTHKASFHHSEFGVAFELSDGNSDVHRYLLSELSLKFSELNFEWAEGCKAALCDALLSCHLYSAYNKTTLLNELRCDQIAWAFKHLPAAIFSHVAATAPCTPLASNSWERMRSGRVPLLPTNEVDAEAEANVGDLLDAVELTSSNNQSPALINQALDCLSDMPDETIRSCLLRWNRSLTALAPKLHMYSPQVGLIISWIAHVVEHGTSQKGTDADPTTRRRYAKVAAIPLFRSIQSLPDDPKNWTKDMRTASLVATMTTASANDKRALSAAISSFQYFLFEAFELRPLDAGLKDFVPVAKPRAQFISELEVMRASGWIATAQMDDERLRKMLQVALWLSFDAPFRITELLHARKGNITKLADGTYEISILPRRGEHLKTAAATRRVWVRSPRACAHLARLMAHRDGEGWASKDLLFGTGIEGSAPHRKNRLRFLLLRALKAATGDPDMTIHALRHAWVCRELLAILNSLGICNFNRLSHLASEVGHESIHTTLEYYFHLMEVPLRIHTDAALRFDLNWSSEVGAAYTGMTASALRQRASRTHQNVGDVVWSELRTSAETWLESLAFLDSDWGIPDAPDLSDKSVTKLTPGLVMNFLIAADKQEFSIDVLSQRHGLNTSQGLKATHHLKQIRAQISRSKYDRRPTGGEAVEKGSPDLQIQKIQQPKYVDVVTCLSEMPSDMEVLRRGVEAWKNLRNRYGYISLEKREAVYDFLSLLRFLGLQAGNFDVVVARNDGHGQANLLQAEIEQVFVSAMVANPHYITGAPPHPTRPSAFLQWHPEAGCKKTSANSDLKGLDAVLLVLGVYLHLAGGQPS